MRVRNFQNPKVQIITLGCAKNIVDSEQVGAQIGQTQRFQVFYDTLDEEYIDFAIINTCGFIGKAKTESINTILEYIDKKQRGKVGKIYVMGCLSERYRADLEQEMPEVDAFLGTFDRHRILQLLQIDYKKELTGERFLSTPQHYAYLKISEGCNRTCSFCAIPLMRGKHKSKPVELLLQEVENLRSQGVKEIILIAQELTYYGLDLYKRRELPNLLEQMAKIAPDIWFRLHYAYPQNFPLDLIRIMAQFPNICPYLDMPLQHASDKILARMRRGITLTQTENLLNKIREICPNINLRTTFLLGFPGETAKDVDILLDFLRKQQFDRVGVFTYSHEEDTRAYQNYKDRISEAEKERRANLLMQAQQEISLTKNLRKVGTILPILLDYEENGLFRGRSQADSPEVDNEIILRDTKEQLEIGTFINAKITEASAYELYAVPSQ